MNKESQNVSSGKQGNTLPTILVILGATGDLATRKLIPALYYLFSKNLLPQLFQVVGFSRQKLSHEEFQKHVYTVCSQLPESDKETAQKFSYFFTYQAGVFEDIQGYNELASVLGRQDTEWKTCANKLFYLAVPPKFYATIFQHLSDSGLTEPCGPDEGWTRVIVEKPFGKDLQTAQELDAMLGTLFKEEQIYRIDHYLGKDTVQNILAFRFSNAFLEPSWDARSIAHIRIQFFEEQGVDGRAEFYDGVGALRDVGQNHMLQMLALFTMENPGEFTAEAIRRERTKILESLEVMDGQDIVRRTNRGQYTGYQTTEGVAKDSQTETYFQLQTYVNTPRWRGMPIYLESGKKVDTSKVEITVTYRHQTPCLCPPGKHYTNVMRYRIQPNEGIFTSFWVKKPGAEMVIEEKDFSFDYHQAFQKDEFVDAYSKLLLDAISGEQTLFVSTAEISASWKFIDPIIKAWQGNSVSLQKYVDGSSPGAIASQTKSVTLPNKEIGYLGLGKMGANMVDRLMAYGWNVRAFDPDASAREKAQTKGVAVYTTAAEVVKNIVAPRIVWLMVPHQVVDEVLEEIGPYLQAGDTVIDGGNSFYKDSITRAAAMVKKGIHFLDVGVSGGPGGAKHGACLMVGGNRDVYKEHQDLFSDLAAAAGYDYMGTYGAGHFVKMVHNGIEYGMMQAIAEGFAVLKQWNVEDLNLERIANLYNHDSVIESRLVGWLRDAYDHYGEDLQDISGTVAHSGEGKWTVDAAKEFGIPVPIIEGALQFRIESQDQPSYTGQIVSALRNQFGGHEVKKK